MGTDSSTLSQTFTTPDPGYLLEFDYFFDFYDLGSWGEWDSAEATLTWATDSAYLFEYNSNNSGSGIYLADDQNIGWTTISYGLPVAGTYTLQFRTVDGPGCFSESILGVDNVSVVPLPSALVLGSLGLGVAGSLVGRFQRRRTRQ